MRVQKLSRAYSTLPPLFGRRNDVAGCRWSIAEADAASDSDSTALRVRQKIETEPLGSPCYSLNINLPLRSVYEKSQPALILFVVHGDRD